MIISMLNWTPRYSSHLGEARDFGIKKGYMSGLGFGFFQIITFASYSLAFWYVYKVTNRIELYL